jgi:hypothetical protein
VQVGASEQRLVGEHLLEVGDQPAGVGRVAAEPADDVVIDPTGRHGVERADPHAARQVRIGLVDAGLTQAQFHQRGSREFGRRPEASPLGVESGAQPVDDRRDGGGRVEVADGSQSSERSGAGRSGRRRLVRSGRTVLGAERFGQSELPLDGGNQRVRLGEHLCAVGLPRLPQRLHDAAEGGHAVALLRREVGAGVEGPPVGRAEDRHRPASRPGERLGGGHVDRVDVRALFAVDLDGDEPTGEIGGRGRVLEALVGHHVAPVARGVAD